MSILNLTNDQFIAIHKGGLNLDSLYLLDRLMRDEPIDYTVSSIKSAIQKLRRKQYLDDEGITQEGINLCNALAAESVEDIIIAKMPVRKVKKPLLFEGWHKEFEDELFKLTGKRQIRVPIEGTKFPYLPGERDLITKLNEFTRSYDITEFDTVKSLLLQYIRRCAKANRWSPLFKYYIMKNGMSDLMTDIESEPEIVEEDKPVEEQIIKTKDLFG